MKNLVLIITVTILNLGLVNASTDTNLDVSSNVDYRTQVIHEKVIELDGKDLKFKWTSRGYGILTYKVIIPELAANTLLNHRNFGEEGPCLSSTRIPDLGLDLEGSSLFNQVKPEIISVSVKATNLYTILKEQNKCEVSLIENVETVIDGEVFNHELYQNLGTRHIDDCLINSVKL